MSDKIDESRGPLCKLLRVRIEIIDDLLAQHGFSRFARDAMERDREKLKVKLNEELRKM